MPIASKMRTLGDAGLYKYKWCNNLREVEQVDIFFLKDIADTIRYLIGNNIGLIYHDNNKLYICVDDLTESLLSNVQYIMGEIFNHNIQVEISDISNLVSILSSSFNSLLGEENFNLLFDYDAKSLYLKLSLYIWQNRINDISKFLNHMLLFNLNIVYDELTLNFIELDYLQSSGTQYIELPEVFYLNQEDIPDYGIKLRSKDYKLVNNNYIFRVNYGVVYLGKPYNSSLYIGMRNTTYNALSMGLDGYNHFPSSAYEDGKIFTAEINFLDSNITKWNDDQRKNLWGVVTSVKSTSTTLMRNCTCKMVDAILTSGTEIVRDLLPLLDDNNIPCLFDKKNKQCFYNAGTGTFGYNIKTEETQSIPFSLRNPYYTAPSGVWVKVINENNVDVVADTELENGEEQGYMWFANTPDAFKHFGIEQEIEK